MFPANFKKPAVSAVRTFPKGCGRLKPIKSGADVGAASESSSSLKALNPLKDSENDFAENVVVGDEVVGVSGQEEEELARFSKEFSVSNKPCKIDGDVDAVYETSRLVKVLEEELKEFFEPLERSEEDHVVDNVVVVEEEEEEPCGLARISKEFCDSEEPHEVDTDTDADSANETSWDLKVSKEGIENWVEPLKDSENHVVENVVEEGPCGFERRIDGREEVLARISKEFFANKRRKVWAVRDFPVGCGRGAPKIVSTDSEASSAESKALNDEKEDGEVRMKEEETLSEAVQEASGEASFESLNVKPVRIGSFSANETEGEVRRGASVKSPKANRVDAEKKVLVTVDNLSARRSEGEVKRGECNDRVRVGVEGETSMATLIKLAKRVAKKTTPIGGPLKVEHVKKNDAMKINVSPQESSSKGHVKSDHIEDHRGKEVVIYSNKIQPERHDVKQVGKHLQVERFQCEPKEAKGKEIIEGAMGCVSSKRRLQEEYDGSLEVCGDRLIAQAMKSAKKKGKKLGGLISHSDKPGSEGKKKLKLLGSDAAIIAFQGKNIVEKWDDENCLPRAGANGKALTIHNRPRELSVTNTPFVPSRLVGKGNTSEEVVNRRKVMRALQLFQMISRKLLQKEEAESKGKSTGINRIDMQAASVLKEKGEFVNRNIHGDAILGAVPGVEVGDVFHYRVELAIVGIHRPYQGGIDYVNRSGLLLATSIVASGGYPDDADSSDVLIYSGAGGMPDRKRGKQAEPQKLERGNLALKNSMESQTPVRVVYGSKEASKSHSSGVRDKMVSTFTYDGLYYVENWWPEPTGPNGFNVYKFQLRRMPGQPAIALKEVKKTKLSKIRLGLSVKDISRGKEKMPICAVNTVDNERPVPFIYITKVIYPSLFAKKPPRGCDCTDGCLDSEKCACALKNGGEIPYNYNGAIVQPKPLIYECGPSCKCPPSCYNRVSQHGIRQPLEIFKTKSRGWGVRSLYSIPPGTFICEYVGVMLDDTEANESMNDEYLFDLGSKYDDHALWNDLQNIIPDMQANAACETVEEVGFTIDAAKYGNVGRFINHSCSPNLYAQNVLFDHHDKRMPHIMLFSLNNIPPLEELTYNYHYKLDQVRDSDGKILKKECLCGSPECRSRLY